MKNAIIFWYNFSKNSINMAILSRFPLHSIEHLTIPFYFYQKNVQYCFYGLDKKKDHLNRNQRKAIKFDQTSNLIGLCTCTRILRNKLRLFWFTVLRLSYHVVWPIHIMDIRFLFLVFQIKYNWEFYRVFSPFFSTL